MSERFNSNLALTYAQETNELFRCGTQSVQQTPIDTDLVNSHFLFASPSYVKNSDNKIMVDLSEPKKINGKIPETLTQPIIVNNEISDGSKKIVESRVTHSDQMHVDALYISLLGMLSGQIKVDPQFSDAIIRRAAALLFGEASIAYFVADSNLRFSYHDLYENGINYVDAGKLVHYVLTPESFYSVLASRGVPTVDVHDFVHHAAQFRTWPQFFLPLYNIQHIVQQNLKEKDIKNKTNLFLLKKLLTFISFATAEYSVVGEQSNESYSFGCLLYQYPRKSPMKKVDLLHDGINPREFTNWNSLRALMSLKRRDLEASREFVGRKKENWMERLGYRLPTEYWPSFKYSGEIINEPVSDLDRSHSINFAGLAFPSTPQELFNNSAKLIGDVITSEPYEIPQNCKEDLEAWLNVMSIT